MGARPLGLDLDPWFMALGPGRMWHPEARLSLDELWHQGKRPPEDGWETRLVADTCVACEIVCEGIRGDD